MFTKKFNIIRYSIIVLTAIALIFLYNADKISSKDKEVELSPEILIEKAKTYISNNKDYFNDIDGDEELDFRISIKELIKYGYIEDSSEYKGYIRVFDGKYEYVNEGNLLVNKLIKDENIVEDTNNENMPFDVKYVYKGEPNNYVSYNGNIYRIMSITNSNHLKLISVDKSTIDKWGSSGDINYFSETIDEEPIGSKGIFFVGYIRSETSSLDQVLKNEKRNNTYTKVTPKYYGYSSYLNVSDVINAANECDFKDITSINKENCKSYLFDIITGTYTANTSENSEVYYINEKNEIDTKELTENVSVNKVIYVNGLTKYLGGDGTLDNPYIIE